MTLDRILRGLRGAVFGLAAALACPGASADVPVTLFKSFAGNMNFTGTQATMRTGQNYCDAYGAKTVLSRTLSGIPAGSKVEAAYVYWAGSGSTADNQITFDGKAITAQRRFTSRYTTAGVSYDYFGGVADVTAQVTAKGNATYTFRDLTINTKNPYCSVQGVLGGFSLLVIYSNATTEPFRVLNVYEGFQNMRYSSITLNVGNFKTPNPLGANTGRLGHITWEGDVTLNQQGEDLKFNGTIMTDAMNPAGNQFNSKSNINGDGASYGVDFDAYTVGPPILQPDQTSATTVYSSGQDMVLLNVEIVAVPNVPVADLAISMSRNTDPVVGSNVTYTLSVTNNGPNQENGPVTVTNSLPEGMSYVSVSGTGWSCATSGQTATCTYNGSVARGTVLPPISVTATVLPSGSGTYTNAAAVSGTMFDNVSINNSASDTSVDPMYGGAGFALTDAVCTAGIRIGAAGSKCQRVTWMVAGSNQKAYITTLDSSGVPTVLYNGNKAVTVYFSLACVNPASAGVVSGASVRATYTTSSGTTTLPVCGSTTATPNWSAGVSVYFNGSASASSPDGVTPPIFYYPDVGLLQLSVTTDKNTVGKVRFVSQPARISFVNIARAADAVANPGNVASHAGFAAAGEPFNVSVRAELYTTSTTTPGAAAPSFGRESTPVTFMFQQAADPKVSGNLPTPSAGQATGQLTYPDVGDISLTPLIATPLNDYLGSGKPVPGVAQTIGRFYPAYFTTSVAAAFDCQESMACPSGKLSGNEDLGVSGAAYSGQPFIVTVTPYNMAHDPVNNYTGTNAKPISLSAVDKPGTGSTATLAALGSIPVVAAGTANPVYSATATYSLEHVYDPASPPPTTGWSTPTTIYLRATAPEKRVTGTGSTDITISSQNSKDIAGVVAEEDGLQLVVGRLQVSNAFGSELTKLPVPVAAKYWSGTSWDTNVGDDTSPLAGVDFKTCTGRLTTGGGVCNLSLLAVDSKAANVTDGTAKVYLKAPGRGNTGSGMMSISVGAPSWLPSTSGRVVFGTNKSPVIYIREVY